MHQRTEPVYRNKIYSDKNQGNYNMKLWKELDSRIVHEGVVFDLCQSTLQNPTNGYTGNFYFIKCTDWVNVIPVTPKNEVVLIRQYRHGAQSISLEIPGGMVDKEEANPNLAARRELEEETGYTSSEIISLGTVNPNPAIQRNLCHFFLAKNAMLMGNGTQHLDPAEDIEVILLPLAEIPTLIKNGTIFHALVICAFFYFFNSQEGKELLQS